MTPLYVAQHMVFLFRVACRGKQVLEENKRGGALRSLSNRTLTMLVPLVVHVIGVLRVCGAAVGGVLSHLLV